MPYKAEIWHPLSREQYLFKHRFSDICQCVFKFLRQKNKDYFENLNIDSITDNKVFWETLYSLLTISKNSKIALLEKMKF